MFTKEFSFSGLALSWRLLISAFVFTLGVGYLSAALNATLAVGLSVDAIADHYGDKTLSSAERQAMMEYGFVEEEFSLDDENMDHTDVPDGAMMDYGAMDGHAGTVDDSLPPQVMAQLSHVHLLGFSLILISIGSLTCMTRLSELVKVTLVVTLFLAFVGDIAGLSLTRFVSDSFAWVTMITGTLIGVCLAIMSLCILWDVWIPSGHDISEE
jgi:hypothetical protein